MAAGIWAGTMDADGKWRFQVYVALIASLLIVLWTGHKPTPRTWEMIQFYLTGWVTDEEFEETPEPAPERKRRK